MPEGHIFIAGIELNQPDSDSGFADWLLQQSRIVIRNAVIEWRDEQRQAPALTLSRVNLRLESSGRRHRLGLQAVPPAELAAPLDIRADLKGEKVADLAAWEGRVYAKLDHADIAAWQTWLPFPFELRHGYGGVQAWFGLKAGGVSEATADIRLNDVAARFATDLPPLDLHSLSGRLSWRPLQADVRFVDSAARFIGDLAEAELQSLQGRLGRKPLPGGVRVPRAASESGGEEWRQPAGYRFAGALYPGARKKVRYRRNSCQ